MKSELRVEYSEYLEILRKIRNFYDKYLVPRGGIVYKFYNFHLIFLCRLIVELKEDVNNRLFVKWIMRVGRAQEKTRFDGSGREYQIGNSWFVNLTPLSRSAIIRSTNIEHNITNMISFRYYEINKEIKRVKRLLCAE